MYTQRNTLKREFTVQTNNSVLYFTNAVMPPQDGNWGAWQAWQGCSVTCGTGVSRRYRNCDDPSPEYGGAPCSGMQFEENACTPGGACPGEWFYESQSIQIQIHVTASFWHLLWYTIVCH